MMIIDSHIHIGDRDKCKKIIENSEYKDIYRIYSCINPDVIYDTNAFIKDTAKYFAIPIFFVESNIEEANRELLEITMNDRKAIPVLLVSYNEHFAELLDILEYNILKEHFTLHNPDNSEDRCNSYDYLSQTNGYLLLHTLSTKTYEHVTKLRKEYPNMNIILAHLGRNASGDYEYTTNMINNFHFDEKVLFDISTIKNPKLIKYAISKCGQHRVLYGSDFPFEVNPGIREKDYIQPSLAAYLTTEEYENLFYNNADRIIEKAKIL